MPRDIGAVLSAKGRQHGEATMRSVHRLEGDGGRDVDKTLHLAAVRVGINDATDDYYQSRFTLR